MRKEDLRSALDRIRPSEALVQATLESVHQQKERQYRRTSLYSFTYRLAGAMCALLLVLGIGVTVGKDAVALPAADTSNTYTRTQFNDVEPYHAAEVTPEDAIPAAPANEPSEKDLTAAIEQLHAKAMAFNGEWLLVQGVVNGCYFLPSEDGISVCAVALDVEKVHSASSDHLTLDETLNANIRFSSSESMQAFVDAMGSKLCLILVPYDQPKEQTLLITDYIVIE